MAGRPRDGAWQRLTTHLVQSGQPTVSLRFSEIEEIIGRPLTALVTYPAFWSNSSSYARARRDAAYASTRARCLPDQVVRPPVACVGGHAVVLPAGVGSMGRCPAAGGRR